MFTFVDFPLFHYVFECLLRLSWLYSFPTNQAEAGLSSNKRDSEAETVFVGTENGATAIYSNGT